MAVRERSDGRTGAGMAMPAGGVVGARPGIHLRWDRGRHVEHLVQSVVEVEVLLVTRLFVPERCRSISVTVTNWEGEPMSVAPDTPGRPANHRQGGSGWCRA